MSDQYLFLLFNKMHTPLDYSDSYKLFTKAIKIISKNN